MVRERKIPRRNPHWAVSRQILTAALVELSQWDAVVGQERGMDEGFTEHACLTAAG